MGATDGTIAFIMFLLVTRFLPKWSFSAPLPRSREDGGINPALRNAASSRAGIYPAAVVIFSMRSPSPANSFIGPPFGAILPVFYRSLYKPMVHRKLDFVQSALAEIGVTPRGLRT